MSHSWFSSSSSAHSFFVFFMAFLLLSIPPDTCTTHSSILWWLIFPLWDWLTSYHGFNKIHGVFQIYIYSPYLSLSGFRSISSIPKNTSCQISHRKLKFQMLKISSTSTPDVFSSSIVMVSLQSHSHRQFWPYDSLRIIPTASSQYPGHQPMGAT